MEINAVFPSNFYLVCCSIIAVDETETDDI